MKIVPLLLALVVPSFAADLARGASKKRVLWSVAPENPLFPTVKTQPRQLKGSSKDSSPKCFKKEFYVFANQIDNNLVEFDGSFGFKVPLYYNGEIVGNWAEAGLVTNESTRETLRTVTLTFNRNTVISMQSYEGQRQYAITGGSGMYGNCIGGKAVLTKIQNDNRFIFEFYICETCTLDF